MKVNPIKFTSLLFFLFFLRLGSSQAQGSSSSYLSKLLTSVSPFMSGIKGAALFLIFLQSIPAKKGWALISATPLIPNLSLGSVTNLLIKSTADKDKFASGGTFNVFLQCKIF